MVKLTSHGACGRRWRQYGNQTSHCGGCHRTFANLGLFDQHRAGDWDSRTCTDPRNWTVKGVWLVQDEYGTWWNPASLASARNRPVPRGFAARTGQTPTPTPESENHA